MSKAKTKEDIQRHKDETINNFSTFMDSLINSSESTDLKRADLISYWIKDFQQYITQEKDFNPTKIKSYKRGDVVKVNLGFNIGSEQGGLRYAIVLDKDNKHNSKTITIIPLTSQKESKEIYGRDILLGRELYNRLKSKYDSIKEEIDARRVKYNDMLNKAQLAMDTLLKLAPPESYPPTDVIESISQLDDLLRNYTKILKEIDAEENDLQKIHNELHRMKDGSIAKIEQITTISKQRIFDPKKKVDVLAGVRFSPAAMDKINEKIKELYIF